MAASVVSFGNNFAQCFPKTKTCSPSSKDLAFVTSQLSGIRISYNPSLKSATPIVSSPILPVLQPVALL